MRTLVLIVLVALVGATGVASAKTESKPSLRLLTSADSLVVRGSGFYAHESVRVTVTTTSSRVRTVRSSSAGSFTADFGTTYVDPCDAMAVRAVGHRGDRAVLKLPQRECATQHSP